MPNVVEFEIIKELCAILEPLKEFTTVLSSRNYASISYLFPTIYHLIYLEINSMSFDKELGDPLLFYKKNEQELMILFSIVKELYSITRTSVPAESLISVAGFIQNEERNRLNSRNFEKITFIKVNSFVKLED